MKPPVAYAIERIRGLAGPGPYEARQSDRSALAQSMAADVDPLNAALADYWRGLSGQGQGSGWFGMNTVPQELNRLGAFYREAAGTENPLTGPEGMAAMRALFDSPLAPGFGAVATVRPDRVVHGTLADLLPSIRENYLTPGVGPNVMNAYGDEAADAALYLARDEDPSRAIAAIRNQVGLKLGKPASAVTRADIEQYGALVVGRADMYDTFTLREGGDVEDLAGNPAGYDYPAAVEPGDVFTTNDVRPTGFMQGRRLLDFIERNGLGKSAWPGGVGDVAQGASRGLDDLLSRWRESGLDVSVSRASDGTLTLNKIDVPKGSRNQGIGTQFMRELVSYADETGGRVVLSPSTDFGASSVNRLRDFYRRFGFVDNKGRNKDFAISETMYRDTVARAKK